MRDEALPRVGGARQEGERRANVPRRVVEGAAECQLLVVKAEGVDRQLSAAEEDDRAARADELERVTPRSGRPHRLDDDVGASSVSRLGAELPPARAAPAGRRPRRPRAPASRGGAQHEANRPGPDDGDGLARLHLGPLDAVQAAGQRLHHRGDLGGETERDGEEVVLGDPSRDEEQLGVGAVQERAEVFAEGLLAAPA